ncbi:MAG: two-component sensor histidine kinase, partial [Oscillospiraceae bacterium]|nr:two-component sensor histidine kinase [Oscillospiraceae bacterium]
ASADGGEIEISAQGGTITVTDHGHGIAPESLARITEPFYTPDKSRSRRLGGVGLGLALVREIADAHGAELEIESAPGAGTSVSMIFEQ